MLADLPYMGCDKSAFASQYAMTTEHAGGPMNSCLGKISVVLYDYTAKPVNGYYNIWGALSL